MSDNASGWVRFFAAIANFFRMVFGLGKKAEPVSDPTPPAEPEPVSEPVLEEEPVPEPESEITWTESQLLSPLRHRRYITIYCIADLEDGDVPIKDSRGNVIHKITAHSKKRLDIEGTGRLSNGKLVNVSVKVDGKWRFKVMGPNEPYGLGVRNKPLEPWVSMAHHLQQLRTHSLFGRKVVVPCLKNYVTPTGETINGEFEIHDTGGGLRKCPYERGLWRTGSTRGEYGQLDLFIGGPESVYKSLLGNWESYLEVVVMPRDTGSEKGIQETLNLLLDSGLKVDGIIGPKSKEAITQLQIKAGLEENGEWDDKTKEFAELSLNNW